MKKIFVTIATVLVTLLANAQSIYTLDKNHTKVEFIATHFEISHVEGRFKNVTIALNSQKEDFTDAVVEVIIDVKSLDTDIEMRDKDLKSANFFDADKYPTITFKSISFKKTTDKHYKLEGNITIHGITKPIYLDVTYNGKALNPMSKKYSFGFTITGKLDRKDFSIGSGATTSFISNEIELISNAEFVVD